MAKKEIIIQLQAYSEPAGKYDPNAPLMGNEDNWYVDDDLSDNIPGRFQAGQDVALSEAGCLMVVADGMGGMNAGEVASQLAIDTVSEYFAPGRITPEMAANPKTRRELLERMIQDADLRIKNDARANAEHSGMGSTIIAAWIVGDKMTLSWCGDSRAYRWNPKFGIEPLSTDHSYVQQLVAQGVITYADTFDHPQGNLVTRSLGDPNNAAKPDTREFDVYQDDIIMLCSDGLSGVLRDKKTPNPNGGVYPGETLQDIIAANADSLVKCSSELMRAAEQADWYDNVTVVLCQIKEGGKKVPDNVKVRDNEGPGVAKIAGTNGLNPKRIYMMVAAALVAIGIVCGCIYFFAGRGKGDVNPPIAVNADSTGVDQGQVVEGGDIEEKVAPKPQGGKATAQNQQNKDKKTTDANKEGEKTDTDNKTGIQGLVENAGEISLNSPETKNELTVSEEQPEIQQVKNEHKPKPEAEDASWKANMLIELANMSVPQGLLPYKNRLVDIVNDKNSKKDKCQELLQQLKGRIQYYNKLMKYNGKIDPKSHSTYQVLYDNITKTDSPYAPKKWDRVFAQLNRCVLPEYKAELGIK